MTDFNVTRIAAPDASILGAHVSRREMGGQSDWYWAVPGVYRALAAPTGLAAVPAAPRQEDSHAASLGYWNALQNILVYRLGWNLPHRGLLWWYESDRPRSDDVLELVHEIWHRDGHLDIYLAWLLILQPPFLPGKPSDPSLDNHDRLTDEWQRWLLDQTERSKRTQHFNLGGGWDPLHLTGHGQDDEAGDGCLTMKPGNQKEAILTTDSATNWYSTLQKLGGQLPYSGERSWRVEVFVTPIGFVGTYRRSRVTGLWFTGKHSLHLRGN
jgi:hypothetical protein